MSDVEKLLLMGKNNFVLPKKKNILVVSVRIKWNNGTILKGGERKK